MKKYELLPVEEVSITPTLTIPMRRIKALIDIPRYGVKTGDIGGYVEYPDNLSHLDDCWIGGNARVSGRAYIIESTLVTDNANVRGHRRKPGTFSKTFELSIEGLSRVYEDAEIVQSLREGSSPGKVTLGHFSINNSRIFGSAYVENCFSINDATLGGSVYLQRMSSLPSKKLMSGRYSYNTKEATPEPREIAKVPVVAVETSKRKLELPHYFRLGKKKEIAPVEPVAVELKKEQLTIDKPAQKLTDAQKYGHIISEIEAEFDAYKTDIVKVIQFPAMVDMNHIPSLEFIKLLRQAKRSLVMEDYETLKDLADRLESAFLNAESSAKRISKSRLSDVEVKKLADAQQMLSIASNEASSETDKKNAFRQAFRALEGIIAVPPEAKDSFREKVGLQAIEA